MAIPDPTMIRLRWPHWMLDDQLGASDEFPQLEEYSQYLSAVVDDEANPRVNAIAKVFGEALERERQAWKKAKALVSQRASDRTKRKGTESVEKDFVEADEDANRVFDMEDRALKREFKGLLERIDGNLQPFPPTAQVAAQQGGSAAFDLPVIGPITGPAAGVAWKLYETSAQLSCLAK
eukprot:Skav212702  [mRNA]  locus=scaffold1930:372998:378185:- [translate_table: standard]